MSADLLRRAAVKLRETADAASKGSWNNDGWEIYAGQPGIRADWIGETCAGDADQDAANGNFIALMHPPVALALAEWIEGHAKDLEMAHDVRAQCDSPGDVHQAIIVAREILREPQS
jgi:hypothetical protein